MLHCEDWNDKVECNDYRITSENQWVMGMPAINPIHSLVVPQRAIKHKTSARSLKCHFEGDKSFN